ADLQAQCGFRIVARLSEVFLVHVGRNSPKGPSVLPWVNTEGVERGNPSSQFDNHGKRPAGLIVERCVACREHHEIPVGVDSGPPRVSDAWYCASDRSVVIADELHRLVGGAEYSVLAGCGKRNRVRFAKLI